MTTLSPAERSYITSGLAHPTSPTRVDGRGLLEPRAIEMSYGDLPAANGSARVRVGGTEVVAGVKLEVVDAPQGQARGREGWRAKVEVDVTPQAFPSLTSATLGTLSAAYAALLYEHFIPTLPALPIAGSKYFSPSIHLALLAADGGVASALVLAARGALADLAIPETKAVGVDDDDAMAAKEQGKDLMGIKGVVAAKKGAGRARARGADDWDLDAAGGTKHIDEREQLPVLVTLNLVPGSDAVFLDATAREEDACTSRVHVFFRPGGRICGLRLEGDEGIENARVRPLLEEAQRIAVQLAKSLNADLP